MKQAVAGLGKHSDQQPDRMDTDVNGNMETVSVNASADRDRDVDRDNDKDMERLLSVVPPPWRRHLDSGGYINDVTGQISPDHPLKWMIEKRKSDAARDTTPAASEEKHSEGKDNEAFQDGHNHKPSSTDKKVVDAKNRSLHEAVSEYMPCPCMPDCC
jgi:hypothetical protein